MKRLIVLGTGHAISMRYHNTCFVLDTDGEYVLVDGGGGGDILRCFKTAEISWQNLHYAFLSHQHTDHLLGMVYAIRYITELLNRGRYEGDFTLYTHDVTCEKVLAICKMLLKPSQIAWIGKRVHIIVVQDGQTVEILGDRYTFFDIHSTKAKQFGFRLESREGINLVFLGDEPFSEQCETYMENCDWLLSEAFCLYRERERYNPYEMHHATVKEAGLCAERFRAKHLVLWHTEDETTYGFRKEAYTEEAKMFYSGEVYVPDDFDVIPLMP